MPDDVRVRRDWIDVRHEFFQADGRWMAGMCAKAGFCRECIRDGEGAPLDFIADAWTADIPVSARARTIVAAHLRMPLAEADDEVALGATPFRRLSIAFDLTRLGRAVNDGAILRAHTIGDVVGQALASYGAD